MSCNAAMTLTLKGNMDPVFSLRLRQRNAAIGHADDHDPHALNMNQADLEKQMLESEYQGANKTVGKHSGQAEPRASGAPAKGRYADDLLNAVSTHTGLTFTPESNPS